jgi:SAM-dependent methyltransferase
VQGAKLIAIDIREPAAKYYDCAPGDFGDLPFYQERIGAKHLDVLELGCGTGRILIPLAKDVGFIQGIDASIEMLAICKRKIAQQALPQTKAKVEVGDITDFELGHEFDLIIAPFRVIQNLETDTELSRMFQSIRKHLKANGSCILNAFRPYAEWQQLARDWSTYAEDFEWEVPFEKGILSRYCKRVKVDDERQITYPDLIYRLTKEGKLVEEVVLSICMRCFYPSQFEQMIEKHGFRIAQKWGGYQNEVYGQGPELIIEFKIGG